MNHKKGIFLMICTIPYFWLNSSTTTVSADVKSNADILINKTSIHMIFYSNSIHLYPPWKQSTLQLYYSVFKINTVFAGNSTSDGVFYSRLEPDQSRFQQQPSLGLLYDQNEMVTFATNVSGLDLSNILMEINVRAHKSILIATLAPFKSYETFGTRNVTLRDSQFGTVAGEIIVSYLIIRPIGTFDPRSESYISTDGLVFAGHRGTGKSVHTVRQKKYIENTISAFNFACNHNAQMVELDVQLSKNKTPVIYHDFDVHMFTVNRFTGKSPVNITVPLKDLDDLQLQEISTNFMFDLNPSATSEDGQSFETLQKVLEEVTPNCGINVEIKYPQLYQKTSLGYESEPGVELNEYVDRILEVLYKYGGNRSMLITSFHADLCAMVQLKQNRYRVGLLTSGDSAKWDPTFEPYYNPATTTVEKGVAFAQAFNLKGISLLADQVMQVNSSNNDDLIGAEMGIDPYYINYVTNRNLSLILWFSANVANKNQLMKLHSKGVETLIFNEIDQVLDNTEEGDTRSLTLD